jgi:hypothetical protein
MATMPDVGPPTRIRKLALGALILGVLAMQAYFVVPHRSGGSFWPFLTYTMYSTPHYAGQPIALRELRAGPCTGPATTALDEMALRVPQHYLRTQLALAAGAAVGARTPDARAVASARATLADLVRRRVGRQGCRLQIWTETYAAGSLAPGAQAPLLLEHEWRGDGEVVRETAR